MTCFASSHPVPDARGLAASEAVMDLASGLSADDHLLLLVSGGGSALLPAISDAVAKRDGSEELLGHAATWVAFQDLHLLGAT